MPADPLRVVEYIQSGRGQRLPDEQSSRQRSLLVDPATISRPNLTPAEPVQLRHASAGVSAEEAAREILSRCSVSGTKAVGDRFSVLVVDDDHTVARFVGALQRNFLAAGYGVADLQAGLDFAIESGWLAVGPRFGVCGEVATYALTQAGLDLVNKGE